MTVIRNISGAPQGIRHSAGLSWLEPEQSRDYNLNDAQRTKAMESDYLEVVSKSPEKPSKAVKIAKAKSKAL